ncbi:unnamed protein product [Adineta ricciae]|uniref:glycogenin glucosyltransferase n=1 Tax=Adineta ricciae TaxID=249248 RepID=A0A814C1M4_ADIRI|nr:unnamed protein product [Adineta ricciae]CAF1111621.1 unnamed protein product [Adineta ricciae]
MVIFTSVKFYPILNRLRKNGTLPSYFILDYETPLEMPPIRSLISTFEQQYRIDPERSYHSIDLYAVWCAKSFMLNHTVELNPFQTKFFLYMDAGAFRSSKYRFQVWPDVPTLSKILDNNRFLLGLIAPLSHQFCPLDYKTTNGPVKKDLIEAGFMAGSIDAIRWWTSVFYETIHNYRKENFFIVKDQYIINVIALVHSNHINVLLPFRSSCGDIWFAFGPLFANKYEKESLSYSNHCRIENVSELIIPFETIIIHIQSMGIQLKHCLLFAVAVLLTSTGIHLLRPLSVVIEYKIKKCDYNITPVLRPMCQREERIICDKLDQVTIYSPCFPSTLLDSEVACHDSYSCDEQTTRIATKNVPIDDVSRKAFFSALYTDNNFLEGAMLLDHTLKKYHPRYQMYIMHFENALSNRTLCSLRQIGWIPRVVKKIPPPLKGTWSHFIDQFTKLTLWNMTEFDSIIYLDTDTLVLNDISHLHELVSDPSRTRFEFAAVADNWHGKFAYHFNAGVLVLHPSTSVFNELIRTMSLPGNYHPTMAEEAFLNAFYQLRYLQLPLIYNVNLAMYPAYRDLWKRLQRDFKVVHFTLVKPFLKQSNTAYDVPLKIYQDVQDEYSKTKIPHQLKTICN